MMVIEMMLIGRLRSIGSNSILVVDFIGFSRCLIVVH
jgi:hypothetical protein